MQKTKTVWRITVRNEEYLGINITFLGIAKNVAEAERKAMEQVKANEIYSRKEKKGMYVSSVECEGELDFGV